MPHTDRPPKTVRRYRAVLAYDGTRYRGFQRQAGDTPTVQGALEAAIQRVTQQAVTIIGAGRTDTGVHATGQVVVFDAAWRHPTEALWRAINANAPDDIALQSLNDTDAAFHPRFDARSRTYEYTLYVAPVRQPILNNWAWHVPARALDLDLMQHAAHLLLGSHDFATFGQPPQGDNTVREMLHSEFTPVRALRPEGRVIRYTIAANAFLYRMVRRIMGALVRVGSGQVTLDAFETAFRAADKTWSNQTAPARGLCLTTVTYEVGGETPAGV
ncbi:MAG: tRNA pseudouridine(38-40) synthase TruA [Anaerolineae bacterium]|nr:tRNA pseudouridine(38-40) synthase TruA [Anaerolineae bacterium]